MMRAGKWFLVGVAACLAAAPQLSFGQSIPVPEYFGVYAALNGHLLKLDGQEVRSEKNVAVKLGQRNAIGSIVSKQPTARPSQNVQVPDFPDDFKIVVFTQAGTQ